MSNPLVSVIIPVYNVEPYLSQCLDSVLNQTYNNIEIIAVNDGSTDKCMDILKEYEINFANINVINQKNSGLSVSRNNGMEKAKGKYIYFLDSDDYILPETIRNLVGLMEEKKLDLIRFSAKPFGDGSDMKSIGNEYDLQQYFEKGKVYDKEEFQEINLRVFKSSACLYIVRRDLVMNNKLQFIPEIYHEDNLFTLELFLNAKASMYEPSFYYRRRYRSNSIMTSKNIEKLKKSFDSYCIVAMEMDKLLGKYNNPVEVKLIKKRIRSIYYRLLHENIEERYKMSSLSKIKGISKRDKLYYTFRYKVKKYLNRH
jgi:glycosyltransferase involved in cell wall biosynthesis